MICSTDKPVLHIDIETYSSADLGAVGVYKYTEAPDFDILLFAYAYDSDPVECVDLTQESLPGKIVRDLLSNDVIKTAFNASFERVCLNRYIGQTTGPWECSMVSAWELGYTGGLAAVGAALGLKADEQKVDGKRLINTFCKPRKPTKNNPAARWLPEDKPEEWARFMYYCKRDVEAERAIHRKLERYKFGLWERNLYLLDQEINDRGILIDTDFARAAIHISNDLTEALKIDYMDLTGLDNPNSLPQLKAWVESKTGASVGSITKETLPQLMEQFAEFPDVVEALQIRATLGKTSVSKYHKMLDTACADNRSRGNLQFFGAKTGRWAGRLIQLQNLPQNHLEDLDTARAVIAKGDAQITAMIYDDVTDTLRQCIRTAIIPPAGKKFVVADFSAIEARVIAWLAGEKWRLDVFERGGDIYCASASQMFGVPVEKHGINGHLRQKGKVAELALGYAGSVGALKAMGALKMGIPEAELQPIVYKWRKASPHVVKLWHEIEDACLEVIETHGHRRINKYLSVLWDSGIMFIVLPSGRRMGYVNARLEPDDMGRNKIVYDDGGRVIETYYGKLTENVVQATARDCLARSMLALDRAGYDIVFHVHDEVIIEVDANDAAALENVCRIMGEPVQWAPGLPLRADGYTCSFYKKD